MLKKDLEQRVIDEALFLISNKSTVRATAKVFNVSKSTVHKDLSERLPSISHSLSESVSDIFDVNTSERHLRGGEATRKKYLSLKED